MGPFSVCSLLLRTFLGNYVPSCSPCISLTPCKLYCDFKNKRIPIWFLQNTNPSGRPLALLLTDLFEKEAVLASSFTECAPWEGGLNIPLSSWSIAFLGPVVVLKGMEKDPLLFYAFWGGGMGWGAAPGVFHPALLPFQRSSLKVRIQPMNKVV